MNLSRVAGGGGIKLAAGQTFNAVNGGIGGINIAGLNINTTTTILSLTGKYLIQALSIFGLGTTGNLVLTVNIDGRVVYSGTIAITQDGLSVIGSVLASVRGPADSIKVESSLTITAQKASTTATLSGIIYAEL